MNKYGPNSPQVELFIDRLKVLTAEEVKRIAARSAAWDAGWIAAWDATREAAWNTTRDTAWDTAWDAARNTTRNTAWDATWAATRAAQAIVVMDLISEEQFQILTEPFAEILAELGIFVGGEMSDSPYDYTQEVRDLIFMRETQDWAIHQVAEEIDKVYRREFEIIKEKQREALAQLLESECEDIMQSIKSGKMNGSDCRLYECEGGFECSHGRDAALVRNFK
jgi:hypothetical protein